ncbi:hypothetical protein GQ53DRAFT_743765 [Thozetella sp. PMI_491]|nr:hypothetical protein GQ53DRAFT_743765 [Thozetella sp. PMI_491]
MPVPGQKGKDKDGPAPARPSSSIILLSPTNQILLLHRVQTSTSFASAHVFPGGNLSSFHEDALPEGPGRHKDSEPYRLAAVRETFEESGILLARPAASSQDSGLLSLPDEVREAGRKEVHGNQVKFSEWLKRVGGVPDIEGLIPFTRWVTPPNVPKRFSTQMYLYMLPLNGQAAATGAPGSSQESLIPTPTHDGGLEHTAATFDSATAWLAKCREEKIVLYPPQMFLMSLIADFMPGTPPPAGDAAAHYGSQRAALTEFLTKTPVTRPGAGEKAQKQPTANIPWADKVMSPTVLFMRSKDQRVVLGLDKPGLELKGTGRGGDYDRVVLVKFGKDGPKGLELKWRDDALAEERAAEQEEESRDSKL